MSPTQVQSATAGVEEKSTVVMIDDVSLGTKNTLIEIDPDVNKRLVRKIDWKIMPVLCFTYALQYYDKATMSQAAVFGMRTDLDLENGLRYSWATLIFSFGYIAGTYPLSFLAQRYPPRIICTIICFLWATITLCTAACSSYAGILANRFALGLVESGVSPIFMLIVSVWYTHSEQVLRSGLWFSFSGGSLLISPIINFGLGHISHETMKPWKFMYLFAGGITFIWGIFLWWWFPESPQTAKGFSEEERQILVERIRENNAGIENKHFKPYQVYEALSDYQFWSILLMSTVSSTGSGAISSFGSIVFAGMGFTPSNAILLNIPVGVMAFLCVIGSAYLGRKMPNWRLYITAVSCLPVILGCCLLWKLPNSMPAGRIVGFYLLCFFSSSWVQCIGLGTSNVAGYTKRAVYAAGTFVGYSSGNIVGPLLFDAKYAPRYEESFLGIMMCFVACIFLAMVTRWLLARENAHRDREYGPPETSHALEDLTDRENKSFRYHL